MYENPSQVHHPGYTPSQEPHKARTAEYSTEEYFAFAREQIEAIQASETSIRASLQRCEAHLGMFTARH